MGIGTPNSTNSPNFALQVFCSANAALVLTNETFPVDKAVMLLSEIEAKIFEYFPKIRQEEEEENLAGAKIYVSDICAKYTTTPDEGPEPAENPAPKPLAEEKMKEAIEKIRQEGVQLQFNINQQLPAQPQRVCFLSVIYRK